MHERREISTLMHAYIGVRGSCHVFDPWITMTVSLRFLFPDVTLRKV
jgi:hypothetical protein